MEVYVALRCCQPVLIKPVDSRLRHLYLPASCLLCQRTRRPATAGICEECATTLPWITSACHHCGLPLETVCVTDLPRCGPCQQTQPPIDHCVAAFHYQEPISRLIQLAKYRSRLDILNALGEQLASILCKHPAATAGSSYYDTSPLPQALVPVPLHYSRLISRGYNQSVELARVLSQHLAIPLLRDRCQRIRATLSQTRLNSRQRQRNIQQAFRASNSPALKHIAIIDDVMTSGQTLFALANTLKRSGIGRIDVWVLARATADHIPQPPASRPAQ